MSNKDLFQKVKELKLPIGKYALFGRAPICVRGLRESGDIDIIVNKELWDEFSKKSEWQHEVTQLGSPCLVNGDIEVIKDWKPGEWNIDKLINESEVIDGLPFVRLESVIEWKKLSGREKDLKDIEAIDNYLRKQK